MARRAARPCAHPGCPALVHDPGQRYCQEHQAEEWRNQSRQRRAEGTHADYGPRWREIRARILRERPTCERCGRVRAVVVHHIVPRSQGGSDDPINLQALCGLCHAQVEAKAGSLFGGRAQAQASDD